jgi:hypothetical protein
MIRPLPRPSRRRERSLRINPVTVCITAIADSHAALVSCVDTRISTSTTSFDQEAGTKIRGILGWTVLNAGTVSLCQSLIHSFGNSLAKATDDYPPTVKKCLEGALRIELPKFCAEKYLSPFGLDMGGFLKERASFTDAAWNELYRSILDFADRYDVQLLVSGWGSKKPDEPPEDYRVSAEILCTDRDGVCSHSDEGFWACGSGADVAHSVLSFFNQEPHMTIARTIYQVASAKFMSERTSGVGPDTRIRVCTRAGPGEWGGYWIQPDETIKIRRMWEKHGAPRSPGRVEDEIIAMLSKHGPQRLSTEHMVRTFNKHARGSKRSASEKSAPER